MSIGPSISGCATLEPATLVILTLSGILMVKCLEIVLCVLDVEFLLWFVAYECGGLLRHMSCNVV